MLGIGAGSVLYILGRPKYLLTLLVAGFLITQAIFSRCIITWVENVARTHYGYARSANDFIMHNVTHGGMLELFMRYVFMSVGMYLMYELYRQYRIAHAK